VESGKDGQRRRAFTDDLELIAVRLALEEQDAQPELEGELGLELVQIGRASCRERV